MSMFNVSNVTLSSSKDSKYVIPFTMNYIQNGVKKSWDLINAHSSVAILIFNVTRKVFVCVKQFRPGVYFNSVPEEDRNGKTIDTDKYPPSLGLTLELCAGIIDKNKSLVEIAREEIIEECGYDVPIDSIQEIQTFRSAVGYEGGTQTFFYTEVTDSMKTHRGGGVSEDGEFIEVVEMTIPEARNYIHEKSVNATSGFLLGLQWFLTNKADQFI